MKQIYTVCSALLLASLSSSVSAGVEYGDRQIYGFFMTNKAFNNANYGDYGFARQTFNTLNSNELIKPFGNNIGLYAATAIDGIYYFAPYEYIMSLQPPEPRPLMTYNIYSGRIEEIGDWNDGDINFKLTDMTYDRKNDRLLALGFDPDHGSVIYEVDRKTGHLTSLRSLPESCGVIAADAMGRILVINVDGVLYQVDMNDAERMIRLTSLPYSALSSNQSLEFDITDNKLYWAACTLDNPFNDRGRESRLVQITLPVTSPEQEYAPGDYTVEHINVIGSEASFLGMYIPSATGGFLAPGYATDIESIPAADGSHCTIAFNAPTLTFGGEALTSLDGYDLYRDGVRIHTEKGITPGQHVTYEDMEVPASGEYRYDIICYSSLNGDGPKSPVFAYVGWDAPAAIEEVNVEVDPSFTSVTLNWDAPQAGTHGGTFDPAKTTYDVLRLPDNVVIAENTTETTLTDNLRRLLRYSYQVTAKNDMGESVTVSREFVAGTPEKEFPVEETFDSPTAMLLHWTPVDYNEDEQTWIFGTTLGHSVFGDYETCAEYVLSPTTVTENVGAADDWLISPPIAFGDDDYAVRLQIRSLTPEQFMLYSGPMNNVECMDEFASFSLRKPEYDTDGRMLFQDYSFQLPESMRNTTGCIGICLASPLPQDMSSYVQIATVTIDTAKALTAPEIAEDNNCQVRIDGGTVYLTGDFRTASVYSAAGVKVMDITSDTADLSALSSGIYILSVDGKSYKLAL